MNFNQKGGIVKMQDIFMEVQLKVHDEIIHFRSLTPYRPNGCEACGAFKGRNREIRAKHLIYINDRFLCELCRMSEPGWLLNVDRKNYF